MAVVGCGDADGIDAVNQELLDGIGLAKAGKFGAGGAPVTFRTASRPRGDRGEHDFNLANSAAVKTLAAQTFEERPVGLLEDHSHPDHADAQSICRWR
jgi:hypothetical protein